LTKELTVKIRVVVTGRNYHTAAPVPEELELGEGQSVDDALAGLAQYLPEGQSFPASCLLVVSGSTWARFRIISRGLCAMVMNWR
jgi:hypothetical protein